MTDERKPFILPPAEVVGQSGDKAGDLVKPESGDDLKLSVDKQALNIFGEAIGGTAGLDTRDMTSWSYRVNNEASAMRQMARNCEDAGEIEQALMLLETSLDNFVNGNLNLQAPGVCLVDVFMSVEEIAKLGGKTIEALEKFKSFYERLKKAVTGGPKLRLSGANGEDELFDFLCAIMPRIQKLGEEDFVEFFLAEIHSLKERTKFKGKDENFTRALKDMGRLKEAADFALKLGHLGTENIDLLCDIIPKLLKEKPKDPEILRLVQDFLPKSNFFEKRPSVINAKLVIALILKRVYSFEVVGGTPAIESKDRPTLGAVGDEIDKE